VLLLGIAEPASGGENREPAMGTTAGAGVSGVLAMGTAASGGVRVSILLGLKAVFVVLLSSSGGFLTLLFLTLLFLAWALGAIFGFGGSREKVFASSCRGTGVALRVGFFWTESVLEWLKGLLLPLQAGQYVGSGAKLGYRLFQVPWSESKKVFF
jgi:hypothetical protein